MEEVDIIKFKFKMKGYMGGKIINYAENDNSGTIDKPDIFIAKLLSVIGYTIGLILPYFFVLIFVIGYAGQKGTELPNTSKTTPPDDQIRMYGLLGIILAVIFSFIGWKIGKIIISKRNISHKTDTERTKISILRSLGVVMITFSLIIAIPYTFLTLIVIFFGPMH